MAPAQAEAEARARELLDEVGVGDRADAPPGGTVGRRAAARRLLPGAGECARSCLLADEPTGNLDIETAAQVFDALMGIVRATGMSALIATHNLELAHRMDRIVHLAAGKVV